MLKNFENYNEELENIGITIKQFSNDNLFSEIFKEQPTNSIDNLNTYIINNYDYDNFDFNKYLTTEEVENMSPEDWENEKNYKIYSNIREKMDHHVDLAEEITHLSEIFRIQYSNIYINFFDTLDSFAEEKNKKNYFILLSIVFQILSLFFLILLFKTIVFNEK